MKRFQLLLAFVFSTMLINAQDVDDVTLIVSGDGATKEEATHVALRSAIEQAYGVFVSANTEILNDELVKDEIATVASGNVKSYTELNTTVLPNGNHMVSLQATVSIKTLTTYAQSKGSACEFAGATFGANLKLLKLNQENTKKAFEHLLQQCRAIAPYIVEPSLQNVNPTADGSVSFRVNLYSTPKFYELCDLIVTTLKALQISEEQLGAYRQMNVDIYTLRLVSDGIDSTRIPVHERRFFCYSDICNIAPDDTFYAWLSATDYWVDDWHFYAEFPYEKFANIIINSVNKYYIADDQENTYPIDFSPLIVNNVSKRFSIGDNPYSNSIYVDAYGACINIGYNKIVLPYKYLKSYTDKKTKEKVYPKRKLGEAIFKYQIEPDLLANITSFEILRDE